MEIQTEDDDLEQAIQIDVQNIVATVNLGLPIELERVAQSARNAEYNPKRFQAVIMRIREPRTTALIFKTGKMIVTGAKKIEDSESAAKTFTAILVKLGYAAKCEFYTIQNMTATCDCGFPISLESFLYAFPNESTYEAELFPGLVFRMVQPKVVLLIFVSGKIVLTGAKSEENLTNALEEIFPKLLQFRKRNVIMANFK